MQHIFILLSSLASYATYLYTHHQIHKNRIFYPQQIPQMYYFTAVCFLCEGTNKRHGSVATSVWNASNKNRIFYPQTIPQMCKEFPHIYPQQGTEPLYIGSTNHSLVLGHIQGNHVVISLICNIIFNLSPNFLPIWTPAQACIIGPASVQRMLWGNGQCFNIQDLNYPINQD